MLIPKGPLSNSSLLAQAGALDFSGGFVIHLAAATSGFVAAAIIGPRFCEPVELSARI